ncbi:hypothetical protein GOV10_03620 [Candidatus Woesearchaeota archaeon]|nr:hypothetical protein [Candidatus Woesearchaeota archaeon]
MIRQRPVVGLERRCERCDSLVKIDAFGELNCVMCGLVVKAVDVELV